MKFVRRFIVIIAVVSLVMGLSISPVNGLVTQEGVKNTPYFSIKYEKNQASVVVRALKTDSLTVSDIVKPKNNVLLNNILSYDTKLPYVSYTIKKPKELENYIDRQINESVKKEKISLKKMTPQQMARIATDITARNIKYDTRMVSYYPEYDREHDDYISELPLDEIIMKEHNGVCRQLAAAYEYITRRIVKVSNSPYLKNIKVDEVVSYDYNHAYNVIYNVVDDKKKGVALEMAFIDPTVTSVYPKSKQWDALDQRHDALFSELIKSSRFSFDSNEKEQLLYQLASFAQQGEISRIQAYAELMGHYNQQIIASLNNKDNFYISVLALANNIKQLNIETEPSYSPESTIRERYQRNRAMMENLYVFAVDNSK